MGNLSIHILVITLLSPAMAHAEVLSSSPTHFQLRHEATSSLPPAALWDKLIDPASWWHPDHTYSGDSANLSLEVRAGGLWREEWANRSVAHGQVLHVEPGKMLRLAAPFGPLQGLGAYVIWTITIEASDGGSTVTFEETASGPPTANLTELAAAVDFVKSEAIGRLTATPDAR